MHVYREDSQSEYSFCLEAAISTSKQIDEDRLTYLNKGYFLCCFRLYSIEKCNFQQYKETLNKYGEKWQKLVI